MRLIHKHKTMIKITQLTSLFILILLTPLTTLAQCCDFTQNANNNGLSGETFGVKLGDLDGDGDLDAITIDAYDAIEVWFNSGLGIFSAGTTYSSGSSFFGVELEDIDNDGDLDIIAISFSSSQATEIWKNNGSGVFSLFQSISNNIGSENSRLADLDGDGDLDLFHTNKGGSTQKIYKNNGSGNFTLFSSISVTGSKSDVALADFDNDGDIDALMSDNNGSNNELWLNDGTGTFTFSATGFATGSNHKGTAAGDFNGDGNVDFVVIGGASNQPAEVYLNNGNATFGSAIVLTHIGSNYDKDVKILDYDNDGDLDIMISNYGSTGVEVWNNDGAANFNLCFQNTGTVYTHDFDAGDVNGDGLVDIYLGMFSSSDGDKVFIQTASPSTSSSFSVTECISYTVPSGNATYTSLGTYTVLDTIPNSNCGDSLMTISLTISLDTSTTTSGFVITSNQTGASYEWIDCDNGNAIIAGETNINYTATTSGNYAVIVTDGACSDTSACVNISTVSIDKNTFNSTINLYPNPSKNEITIDFGTKENFLISIISITGKEVYRLNNLNGTSTKVSLTNLKQGIYFVKVQSNTFQKTIKLIKQ